MTQRALLGISFLLLVSQPLLAQHQARTSPPDLVQLLQGWHDAHGSQWRFAKDPETGWLQMLYGGRTEPVVVPDTDEGFFDLARKALGDSDAMHGIDAVTLEPVRTLHLPLVMMGSVDKMTVRFRQAVQGVPVEDAFVNALFDMRGRLLSIQSTGMPRVAGFDVQPVVGPETAVQTAVMQFRARTRLLETSISGPELVVDQDLDDGLRYPRLAWKVDVHADHPDTEAAGFEYFVDAKTGAAYRSQTTVHHFDVGGTVTSNATPGVSSDNPANPPVQTVMPYMSVTSGTTTVQTDVNGAFNLPGLTAPVQATVGFAGPWCVVLNDSGANYSLTTTLNAPSGNSIQMAVPPTETTTASANVFRWVQAGRDYIKALNPSDTTADFTVIAHAMVNSNCNATYNGSAINFYRAGSGCSNFAFSTIVNHELGHWMNSRYGTGNGSDGMGEGNADIWALYIHDSPFNGLGAFNGSGFVRTGTNTTQFCGDAAPGCHGGVHDNGEVWMGAAWKIRERLNVALGDAPGDLVADSLFLGWMNAFNQTQIKSIIETQWLTLDDDNGNILDGTPHFDPIDRGFRDQGFPGYPDVLIDNVVHLSDTVSTNGPYVLTARIRAQISPPIVSAFIRYRVDGGPFLSAAMTHVGGDIFSGFIPGQAAKSHIEYYVSATSSSGASKIYPTWAPGVPLEFDIGVKHILRSHDFEAGTTEGWTNGSIAGNNEWQRGNPAGKFGSTWSDPGEAVSPNNVWGQDLGNGTGGTYSSNSNTWLRSPITDCSTAVGTRLRFNRWLSVQGSGSDQARIRVNGTQIYINPSSSINDSGWVAIEHDISSLADGNPSVQIEWSLQANGSSNRGGWNIDDVRIVWVEDPPTCPATINYCIGAPNSVGPGATMSSTGSQFVAQNDFTLMCTGCPPFTVGLFFYGSNAIQAPFGNGFRCVGGTIHRLGTVPTDFLGDAVRPIDFNVLPHPIQGGETWRFQYWYRNPAGGGAGFNLSDGLEVPFCP